MPAQAFRRGQIAIPKRNRPELVHHSSMLSASITARIAEQARKIGFDLCGVARAERCQDPQRLAEWLERGYAGEMRYLHDPRRLTIGGAMPDAHAVIVCAMNYNTPLPYSRSVHENPHDASVDKFPPRGWVSRYAWGDDYHDVLKAKLEQFASWMHAAIDEQFQTRTYVDTGPVLERLAAKEAGLGWLAKNTCLINQKLGSWLFLGVILTDLDLAPSIADGAEPARDLCGSCTRCIDACPTSAFIEPYVMDARRCISYLTIELRDSIPEELRPAMGSMVFGCDICQDVCPWNRKSPATALAEFLPRKLTSEGDTIPAEASGASDAVSLFLPELEWLVTLSEEKFRRIFRGSPVKRAKWRGMLRNACVVLGNSALRPENLAYARIVRRLEDLAGREDANVAEHAAWALKRIRGSSHRPGEGSPRNPPSRKAEVSIHSEEK